MKLANIVSPKNSERLLQNLQTFYSSLTTAAVQTQIQTKSWREERYDMVPDYHWYIPDYSKPPKEVERISYHKFVSGRLANLRKDISAMMEQVQAGIQGNVEEIVNRHVLEQLKQIQNNIQYTIDDKRKTHKINRVYARTVRELMKKSNLWKSAREDY